MLFLRFKNRALCFFSVSFLLLNFRDIYGISIPSFVLKQVNFHFEFGTLQKLITWCFIKIEYIEITTLIL